MKFDEYSAMNSKISAPAFWRVAPALIGLVISSQLAVPVAHSATHRKQTPQEASLTLVKGREEPAPEVLQPTVEADIPDYQPRRDIELVGLFKGAISDTMPRLVHNWIAEFENIYPHVRIDVPPPYSGHPGAVGITDGTLSFAMVSRELTPDDIKTFTAKHGYGPLSVPISGGSYRQFGFLDAGVFIVHDTNPISGLTYQQLDRIFSSTHYRGGTAAKTWGDVGARGEWANKQIRVYAIKPYDGIEEFMRQKVLSVDGKRGEWTTAASFEDDGILMADHVSADPLGITYESVGLVNPTGNKMLAIARDEKSAYVEPSYENVVTTKYPFARVMYINFNKVPGQPLDPALVEFTKFILSKQGQQAVVDHGLFLPLRKYQIESSRELLERK